MKGDIVNPEDPGKHIKWKLNGVPFDKLADVKLVGAMLVESVRAVGMRPLDGARIYDVHQTLKGQGLEPDPEEPEGVTGIVVLSTSHAAVHTWPHQNFAYFDLFSCRDFAPERVELVFQRFLGPQGATRWDFSYSLRLESDTPLRQAAREAHAAIVHWGGPGNVTARKLEAALDGPTNGKTQ